MKPPKSSDELNREKRLLEKQIAALEQDLGDFEYELKEFRPRSLADHQLETLSHAINDAPNSRTDKSAHSRNYYSVGDECALIEFCSSFRTRENPKK